LGAAIAGCAVETSLPGFLGSFANVRAFVVADWYSGFHLLGVTSVAAFWEMPSGAALVVIRAMPLVGPAVAGLRSVSSDSWVLASSGSCVLLVGGVLLLVGFVLLLVGFVGTVPGAESPPDVGFPRLWVDVAAVVLPGPVGFVDDRLLGRAKLPGSKATVHRHGGVIGRHRASRGASFGFPPALLKVAGCERVVLLALDPSIHRTVNCCRPRFAGFEDLQPCQTGHRGCCRVVVLVPRCSNCKRRRWLAANCDACVRRPRHGGDGVAVTTFA